MNHQLLYGKGALTIQLPEHIQATPIIKHPMPVIPDTPESVKQALLNPVQSPPLADLAKSRKTACILICDITRPVPNGLVLPALVDALTEAGMKKENILILVATGLHRPNLGEELRELIGSDDIYNTVRIENHFARDRSAHVDLGYTSSAIPIGIDRRFIEAELKIVTGLVEPHFMAGYSGGRKVVAPGIAYQDTILKFHTAHVLEHQNSDNCILEGNPLHQAQLEIIRAIGDIYAVNTVIDDRRRLGKVTFGDIEASHLEAVEFMKKYAEIQIDRKFRTIVTSAGGYPLDKTYYQTVKGMVGPLGILEKGGTLIIASECSEGMGSPEFVSAQKMLCRQGQEMFMETLYGREEALIDEWQTEMLLKPLRHGSVKLYTTNLSETERQQTCVELIDSVETAIVESVREQGSNDIAVIPEGPYVIPLSREPG
ncbi:MAG: nickel-dependent lactate racemase [Desulfocapsaceae bacterium]|jgi:nickel-dependent lactate racemase|nr:nickel-dependent lactate racemase [Desulfocapsaceae bacterium]